MVYLSDNIILEYAKAPSTEGVYQYDVTINQEIIFVGNVYLKAGQTPTIDITEILRKYANPIVPSYPQTPTLTNLKVYVASSLYINDTETESEVEVCMIYLSPFYNSKVSTPVLYNNKDTDTDMWMPMLQGWDYLAEKGVFLPTYPRRYSEILTFDMVGNYLGEKNHTLHTIYPQNRYYLKQNVNIPTSGVYNYSTPLSVFMGDLSGTSETQINVNEYITIGTITPTTINATNSLINGRWQIVISNDLSSMTTVQLRMYHESSSFSDTLDEVETTSTEYRSFTGQLTFTSKPTSGIITIGADNSIIAIVNLNLNQNFYNSGYDRLCIKVGLKLYQDGSVEIILSLYHVENYSYTLCDIEGIGTNSIKLANIDKTNSRFFLKWMDRYGMPQIQPFAGLFKYSEGIERNTITNYQHKKKIIDITNTPKWHLNSRWIDEQYFPYYESIFVSPYLQLYDAEEDKIYNVLLVNSEYEEKTNQNQNKRLFNLQLDVELDTTQFITY